VVTNILCARTPTPSPERQKALQGCSFALIAKNTGGLNPELFERAQNFKLSDGNCYVLTRKRTLSTPSSKIEDLSIDIVLSNMCGIQSTHLIIDFSGDKIEFTNHSHVNVCITNDKVFHLHRHEGSKPVRPFYVPKEINRFPITIKFDRITYELHALV